VFYRVSKTTWRLGRMLLVRRYGRVYVYAERFVVSFPEAEVKFHRGGIIDLLAGIIDLMEKPAAHSSAPPAETDPSAAALPVLERLASAPTETRTPAQSAAAPAAPAVGRSVWGGLRFALALAWRVLLRRV
jgi:hypothetical protein